MHDADHWLNVLGLGPEATQEQIDEAYRELVKVWHPDRFESDPRLRQKAEAKLREVNSAFENLRGYRPRKGSAAPTPPRASQAPRSSSEERNPGARNAWIFAGVSVATAATIGALLYFGIPRDTGPQADDMRPAPEVPPQPRLRPKVEPPTPEAPAPAAPTTGMLTVFSQPTGATVFLDDRGVGQTPLSLPTLAAGEHRVRLELAGFPTWSSPVLIDAGGGEKLLAILERKRETN